MKNRPAYRIRNWTEYDTSLRRRGSLTFWISTDLLENWTTKEKSGGRGASRTYTDSAIETLAMVKYLFRQASRQAEGLLSSIFELMRLMLPVMLAEVRDEIRQVSCDGIYDQRKCYKAINRLRARAIIPPRRGARIWQHGNSRADRLVRDENLRAIRKNGRKKWKEDALYHRRSLAETTVFRYKITFGDRLQSRKIENQFTEMFIKCAALNRMVHLGMPQSYK